jgi:hypothetical protein
MKSRVYHSGKTEASHQLAEVINEAAVGIRNELGRMQWQHSMGQRLEACMQSNGGHFEHVL